MRGKPLSKEKKEMIINARSMGKKVIEICKLYFVKKSAVYELYKKYDASEKIEEPRKATGRPAKIDSVGLSQIRERLIEKNDITLQELIDELSLPVCQSALSRILRSKLDSHCKKKTLHPKEQEREDVKKNGRIGVKNSLKRT
jgi:transposase